MASPSHNDLTQCGPVIPNGVDDVSRYWCWQHQTITWTSADLIIILKILLNITVCVFSVAISDRNIFKNDVLKMTCVICNLKQKQKKQQLNEWKKALISENNIL